MQLYWNSFLLLNSHHGIWKGRIEFMKNNSTDCEIVLATFNGGKYLKDQLDSLEAQTVKCNILCHDDGSSDNTLVLLKERVLSNGYFRIISGPPMGSASQNFSLLLGNTTANYVFCADQDDVWLPDKVEHSLKVIQFYEQVYGSDTPLMVHSDLTLIDDCGKYIASSMWKYQNLDPEWGTQFNLLLTQNVVAGCSMVVNRALLNLALPIPATAIMHDWWLALIACAFGKVIWEAESKILYRQHATNVMGTEKYDKRFLLLKLISFGHSEKMAYRNHCRLRDAKQAEAFAKRFPTSSYAVQASLFAQLPQMHSWQRRHTILQQRFFKIGKIRNMDWLV
ncbi:glycosyltransferase family 2 protein [Deinococcus sp. AJ005]|uniref:glycosyltransferase family 2 protein n=1 Tax=Deinococcus sp. AJ005 TaxID=2652443 RepID=UPI00125CA77A|nr:glycosyltransferase family 2 protein [Deinococcus sp. AJ005]QFP77992.1 glycosyltransferase family 2 protein [Deinococcus sp. AJ005]